MANPDGVNRCQLCNWEGRMRNKRGPQPKAVAKVAGVRICAHHARLVCLIRAAAGRPLHRSLEAQ